MILDPSQLTPIDMSEVIGRSYIFGRLSHLPRGFHVEALGTMTLQEDGSISGYRNSAETAWKPFDHGFVFADSNRQWWFPTSLWSHSYQGMILGYCNHTRSAPHNLCLLPDVPMQHGGRFMYIIASCERFYRTTIPRLLDQFRGEGIEAQFIKIVVNGSRENLVRTEHGVEYCFTTHRGWEFSAFYEAPRWDFDYALILQDTSELEPGFRRKCETMNGHFAWDLLPACLRLRCSTGIFRHGFLGAWREHLGSLDGLSKHEAVVREVAAEMITKASRVLSMGDSVWSKHEVSKKFGESDRFKVEFPFMGIRKYIHKQHGYGSRSSLL